MNSVLKGKWVNRKYYTQLNRQGHEKLKYNLTLLYDFWKEELEYDKMYSYKP